MEQKKEQQFIFGLIDSALNQKVWTEIPEDIDWQYVYTLCEFHKIANLVSYALDYAAPMIQEKIPEKICRMFLHARQQGLAREATQYFSLEEIRQKFEEQQICNILLKGAQLKSYYPSPDMRFLTDLDILCCRQDADRILKIMEELGYTRKYEGGHHDVYVRKPFMTVEIHWSCSTENKRMDPLFASIWERCMLIEGWSCSYQMRWEDYYVYMIGHMEKHLRYSGIGIRMLLDLLVFEKGLYDICDWERVHEYLEEANVLLFSKTMSCFLKKCLQGVPLVPQDQILLEHIWESGAYGTSQNHAGMRFLKDGGSRRSILKNKICLFFRILFPALEGMQQNYTYLRRCPLLLPAAWIERLVKKTLFENRKSRRILKNAGDTRYLKKMDSVCRAAGLY